MSERQSLRAALIILANVLLAPMLVFPAYGTIARVPFPGIRTFVVILCTGLAVTVFLLTLDHVQRRPPWLTVSASVLAVGMPTILAWVWTLRDLLGHDPDSLLRSATHGVLYTATCWVPLSVGNALAVRRLADPAGE